MNRRKSRSVLIFIFLAVIISSCTPIIAFSRAVKNLVRGVEAVSVSEGEWDPSIAEIENVPEVIPESTKALDNRTQMALKEISPDGDSLIFDKSTKQLEDLEVGNVIVGEQSDTTPDGFLKKIIEVDQDTEGVRVRTESATLEDAIESGNLDETFILDSGDIEGFEAAVVGMSGHKHARPPLRGIVIDLDETILADRDGNYNTTYDQVKANGSISITPSFDFKMTIKNYTLTELVFLNNTEQFFNLDISGGADAAGVQDSRLLGTYRFKPITVWVGYLPVYLRPVLTIHLSADGNISTDLTAGISQTSNLNAGLVYRYGNWQVVDYFDNNLNYTMPSLTASCSLVASISPQLDLLIYGKPGPYMRLDGYLQLAANPNNTPWWQLDAGLNGYAGIEVEVLGKSIVSYEANLFNRIWPLAQAESSPQQQIAEEPPSMDTTPQVKPTSTSTYTPMPTFTPLPTSTQTPLPTSTPTEIPPEPTATEVVRSMEGKWEIDLQYLSIAQGDDCGNDLYKIYSFTVDFEMDDGYWKASDRSIEYDVDIYSWSDNSAVISFEIDDCGSVAICCTGAMMEWDIEINWDKKNPTFDGDFYSIFAPSYCNVSCFYNGSIEGKKK